MELKYEGPEELDPVQPTQEEIDEMIANWQKESKKSKNPRPMPEFNTPRMKKPEPVLVDNESGRTIRLQLLSEEGKKVRLDFRKDIA